MYSLQAGRLVAWQCWEGRGHASWGEDRDIVVFRQLPSELFRDCFRRGLDMRALWFGPDPRHRLAGAAVEPLVNLLLCSRWTLSVTSLRLPRI